MESGSFLDLTCGGGEHSCDGRSCVRIHSFQKEDLAIWFGDITENEKSEVQIMAVLHEYYRKYSNGVGVLLEDVRLTVTGDAGVRVPLGDSIDRGVMAWGVANNPEAHQRVKGWS